MTSPAIAARFRKLETTIVAALRNYRRDRSNGAREATRGAVNHYVDVMRDEAYSPEHMVITIKALGRIAATLGDVPPSGVSRDTPGEPDLLVEEFLPGAISCFFRVRRVDAVRADTTSHPAARERQHPGG